MSGPWTGERVLVTGGRGFLGRYLCRALSRRGADVVAAGRAEADLRDREAADRLFMDVRPTAVLHAAVEGGGIGWMREHPVASGRDNTLINVHALDSAWRSGARLFVGVSSACAYPRDCPVPFREDALWDGAPEPTNGPYAQSKRLLMELGRAWHDEHGLAVAFPVLANLYGPGDHLSPARAHVTADLLLRCLARPDELVVWGTGRATRELLHVADAAEGVIVAAEHPSPEPVNIGTGVEVPIAELAREVALACAFEGPIRFDSSRPGGQPRKCLDVTRARDRLSWSARIPLPEGLRETAAWYREQLAC